MDQQHRCTSPHLSPRLHPRSNDRYREHDHSTSIDDGIYIRIRISGKDTDATMTLTGAEVAGHNSKDSCWVIVHGKAYDVTEFLPGKPAPLPFVPLPGVPKREYRRENPRLTAPQNTPAVPGSSSSTPARTPPRSSTPSTRPTRSTSTSTRPSTWAPSTCRPSWWSRRRRAPRRRSGARPWR